MFTLYFSPFSLPELILVTMESIAEAVTKFVCEDYKGKIEIDIVVLDRQMGTADALRQPELRDKIKVNPLNEYFEHESCTKEHENVCRKQSCYPERQLSFFTITIFCRLTFLSYRAT